MPLTPADIHNMAFKKPPMGKRGYDEEEVDAFLDEVEQELIRLLEENEALRDQMGHGGGGGVPASPMALNAELSSLVAQLERLQEARDRAEQNARGLQAELERARGVTGSGRSGSEERGAAVLMMAQRTADEHLRDARREAEELVASAMGKAEQITTEAEMKAGGIESDARQAHAEALDSIVVKREALLEEIERLGELAHSYHAALTSHVTQQLQELNGAPETAADSEL